MSFRWSSFGDDTSFGGGNDNEGGAGAGANVNGVCPTIGSILFQSSDDTAFVDTDTNANSESNDNAVGSISGDSIHADSNVNDNIADSNS